MKKTLSILLVTCLLLMTIPGLSFGEKSIVIQTYTDNGNLNPYVMNTNAEPITGNVYENLFYISADYEKYVLATAIDATDDPLNNIIHLREGVKFSNGFDPIKSAE